MLYYLFDYLDKNFDLIGAGVFKYISFRAGMAAFISLLITITFGEKLISYLKKKQVGEEIRELGLEGHTAKKGTRACHPWKKRKSLPAPSILREGLFCFPKLQNITSFLCIPPRHIGGIWGRRIASSNHAIAHSSFFLLLSRQYAPAAISLGREDY